MRSSDFFQFFNSFIPLPSVCVMSVPKIWRSAQKSPTCNADYPAELVSVCESGQLPADTFLSQRA